jgi:hypothetical protein
VQLSRVEIACKQFVYAQEMTLRMNPMTTKFEHMPVNLTGKNSVLPIIYWLNAFDRLL